MVVKVLPNDLAACPCGQKPERLHIVEGQCMKWAWVSGSCCGEWNIEFRTMHKPLDSTECMRFAAEAWNNASRGCDNP